MGIIINLELYKKSKVNFEEYKIYIQESLAQSTTEQLELPLDYNNLNDDEVCHE